MKKPKELEWRMYGLVPYNISPIQQGIQFGHAVVEYSLKEDKELSEYRKWAIYDKTFIILNGGTTNILSTPKGTLNQHLNELINNNIAVGQFYEPDLGDQLTAVVFLVEERVWNKEKYPDFVDSICYSKTIGDEYTIKTKYNPVYKQWIDFIGGDNNLWLRQFLKQFRLA